ncbi:MAG: enoyl-CoA hydratase/isomerase family protein [Actinobacteria bacterium]|nr:enoyl-CoA hydratase/isomerase family protein [Actinomycetota bacterium]
MTYQTLKFDLEEAIGLLTLNRPERLNAVNAAMLEELNSFWEDMQGRQDCRVIVMTGAGERGFCSGLDLKEASDLQGGFAAEGISGDSIQRGQLRFSSIVEKMRACPQPVIAAVNGAAMGAGLSFAMAADVRIASPPGQVLRLLYQHRHGRGGHGFQLFPLAHRGLGDGGGDATHRQGHRGRGGLPHRARQPSLLLRGAAGAGYGDGAQDGREASPRPAHDQGRHQHRPQFMQPARHPAP